MSQDDSPPVLSRRLLFDQVEWHVEMVGGGFVVIMADGFTEDDENCIFTVLIEGSPNVQQVVATVPLDLVSDVFNP
jgi:hypothetical protein